MTFQLNQHEHDNSSCDDQQYSLGAALSVHGDVEAAGSARAPATARNPGKLADVLSIMEAAV